MIPMLRLRWITDAVEFENLDGLRLIVEIT